MEPGSLFGNGARLFGNGAGGNGARPHPETEHGSIWNFAWKWSPLYLENAARLHLEWNPALSELGALDGLVQKGSGLRP